VELEPHGMHRVGPGAVDVRALTLLDPRERPVEAGVVPGHAVQRGPELEAQRADRLHDVAELVEHAVVPAEVGVVVGGQRVPWHGPDLPVGDSALQAGVQRQEAIEDRPDRRGSARGRELGLDQRGVGAVAARGQRPAREVGEADPLDVADGLGVEQELGGSGRVQAEAARDRGVVGVPLQAQGMQDEQTRLGAERRGGQIRPRRRRGGSSACGGARR